MKEALQFFGEQLKQIFTAKTIYGEAIERDGITVVPVSRVNIRGGFGVGKEKISANEGGGGGMDSSIRPVGFLKVGQGKAKFVPAFDIVIFFYQIMGILAILLSFVLLLLRLVKKKEQTQIMQQLIKAGYRKK